MGDIFNAYKLTINKKECFAHLIAQLFRTMKKKMRESYANFG